MSEHLERGVEITKLARLLGVEPKEIGYLETLPAAALRTFREQLTDRLFSGDAGRLRRVAAASKLLPVPLTVKIAQVAFGPVLCAATAGLLDPAHAVKVASKCPTTFLADITIYLDPRRAPDVIAAVPTPLVVAVAKELLARGEHVTMGRFVSYLSRETLGAALKGIPDDADVLKVAFVMEGKENLDEFIDLARDRIPGLVRTAYEHDLWAEALDLIGHVSTANLGEIAEITTAEDDELLSALVHAANDLQAWDVVLPVTATMSADSLQRFAQVPAIYEPEVLRAVIEAAAARHELWEAVLPLADVLPDEVRPRIALAIGELTREQMLLAMTAASRSHNLVTLIDIALLQEPVGRQRVLEIIGSLDDLDEFAALLTDETPEAVWSALVGVRAEMPDRVRGVVQSRATDLGRDDVAKSLTGG